ncbi:MAG: putative binding protein precursor [Syntrophorhabdus sp. PtaU1.Bin002]|nr:MAG: putative binding protein precursor [Syntrophorhabdus sp. PtaU1.Bin002]
MAKKVVWFFMVFSILCFGGFITLFAAEPKIMAFCGSASKPAMEEAADRFKKLTGIQVDLNFGGSGTMLSQMRMARRGDLFIPASPDYIVKAEKEGVIDPGTVKIVAYLIPAIAVQPGNPKGIRTLSDLSKPGIKVGLANPETVVIGRYAVEVLEKNGLLKDVKKNIVTHAASAAATEALIVMKKVDAVIGWEVFSHWNPGKIETVFLKPNEVPRIAYIPAAVSSYTTDKGSARKFIDFLVSPEGKKIFTKWGYAVTDGEIRKYAPKAIVGGEYVLPRNWNTP